MQIRTRITDEPAAWKKAAYGKRFTDVYTLGGDSLVRLPKGVDPDHPYAEDIKRKDFIGGSTLTDKQVSSDSFLTDYTDMCKRAAPFMSFLCDAVGGGVLRKSSVISHQSSARQTPFRVWLKTDD